MNKHYLLLLLLLAPWLGRAQSLSAQLKPLLPKTAPATPAATAVAIGKKLIGAPYVAHTLDQNPNESLVVNLNRFDCTTFLETVLALALTHHELAASAQTGTTLEQTYRQYLTQLRYRNGRIDGYASRLHYFSEWLREGERNGFLTDITASLPGSRVVNKPLSYMTSLVNRYPRLTDPAIYRQVAQTEADLGNRSFAFVPRTAVAAVESELQDGDMVMLMAARPGLDMKHVGFVVRAADGSVHLLHASSVSRQVEVTTLTLSAYLHKHPQLSGIRVARLRTHLTGADKNLRMQ